MVSLNIRKLNPSCTGPARSSWRECELGFVLLWNNQNGLLRPGHQIVECAGFLICLIAFLRLNEQELLHPWILDIAA